MSYRQEIVRDTFYWRALYCRSDPDVKLVWINLSFNVLLNRSSSKYSEETWIELDLDIRRTILCIAHSVHFSLWTNVRVCDTWIDWLAYVPAQYLVQVGPVVPL